MVSWCEMGLNSNLFGFQIFLAWYIAVGNRANFCQINSCMREIYAFFPYEYNLMKSAYT